MKKEKYAITCTSPEEWYVVIHKLIDTLSFPTWAYDKTVHSIPGLAKNTIAIDSAIRNTKSHFENLGYTIIMADDFLASLEKYINQANTAGNTQPGESTNRYKAGHEYLVKGADYMWDGIRIIDKVGLHKVKILEVTKTAYSIMFEGHLKNKWVESGIFESNFELIEDLTENKEDESGISGLEIIALTVTGIAVLATAGRLFKLVFSDTEDKKDK